MTARTLSWYVDREMTRRGRTYSPGEQAAALAALAGGDSQRAVSRATGIPETTIRRWVLVAEARGAGGTPTGLPAAVPATASARAEHWDRIAELWPVYLEEHLQVTLAVLSYIRGHEEWIAAQDAHGLATLVGVLGDKARLLTEAMERAAKR